MDEEKVYKIKCNILENDISNKIVETLDISNLDNTINYSIIIRINKNNYIGKKKNEIENLLSSNLDNTIQALENMGLSIKEADIVGCILEELDDVIVTLKKSDKKTNDLTVKSVMPDQEFLLDKLLNLFSEEAKRKKEIEDLLNKL